MKTLNVNVNNQTFESVFSEFTDVMNLELRFNQRMDFRERVLSEESKVLAFNENKQRVIIDEHENEIKRLAEECSRELRLNQRLFFSNSAYREIESEDVFGE